MRKLLSLLFTLSVSLIAAQTASDSLKTLELGWGAGFWSTEVGFSPTVDQEPFNGLNTGLALRYFDKKTIGFQAELNIDQAGWREIQDSVGLYYRRSISFLTLQLFTQVTAGNGRFRPLIQAGPYVSFPLSDQEFIPPTVNLPEDMEPTYYQQPYPKRLTYGLVFGAGFYYKLGPIVIQAEGRFLAGFSDLYRSGSTQAETSRRQSIGARVTAWYRW